jgi:uncharacterized phage protein (TIGR02218 family)
VKTISSGLSTHLAGELTTLTYLFKITRTDGQIKAFTTFDEDLTYGGLTYESSASYTPTAVQTTSGMEVGNLDVDVLIDSAGITEAELMAGVYDFATIEIFQLNYRSLGDSQVNLRKGKVGQVSLKRGLFTAELRDLMQFLQQTIGRAYSRRCDADLGDSRCKVNLAPHTVTGTVSAVTSRQVFTASSVPTTAGGKLTWTSGNNTGFTMEVKSISGSVITLNLAMPYEIQVGDGYSVYAGCDKRLSTCRDTFNNIANLRGHGHYIPGQDKALQFPDRYA